MPLKEIPPYPIIDPQPTFGTVFRGILIKEWALIPVVSVAVGATSVWFSRRRDIHRYGAVVHGCVAGIGVFCYGLQKSAGRLLGFIPPAGYDNKQSKKYDEEVHN